MTPRFHLRRVSILPVGAFGVLLDDGVPFALTLERTYPVNARVLTGPAVAAAYAQSIGKSEVVEYPKIAPGDYECVPTVYHKRRDDAVDRHTYEIRVPGHSRLLFHVGNVEDDSEGCVLVGEQFEVLGGQPAIALSGKAFREFARRAGGQPFTLRVEDPR